mmetsp:Transcript_60347/g.67522  ORF Transcript_60347/g.67522 Transcript_60347/m.67522 type:complete len:90 (-) Transcript_60347:225-494(-)
MFCSITIRKQEGVKYSKKNTNLFFLSTIILVLLGTMSGSMLGNRLKNRLSNRFKNMVNNLFSNRLWIKNKFDRELGFGKGRGYTQFSNF